MTITARPAAIYASLSNCASKPDDDRSVNSAADSER